jgi:hypothetical protein
MRAQGSMASHLAGPLCRSIKTMMGLGLHLGVRACRPVGRAIVTIVTRTLEAPTPVGSGHEKPTRSGRRTTSGSSGASQSTCEAGADDGSLTNEPRDGSRSGPRCGAPSSAQRKSHACPAHGLSTSWLPAPVPALDRPAGAASHYAFDRRATDAFLPNLFRVIVDFDG